MVIKNNGNSGGLKRATCAFILYSGLPVRGSAAVNGVCDGRREQATWERFILAG